MATIVRLGFFLSFFLLFLAPLTLSRTLTYVYELTAAPSGFSSLKNFQGSKRGDNIKGLYEVKKYLNQFGYLPLNHNKNDKFDEELESAIMTYQLKFNLEVTGVLDSGTVSKMMAPRCGVADIFNGPKNTVPMNNFHKITDFWKRIFRLKSGI